MFQTILQNNKSIAPDKLLTCFLIYNCVVYYKPSLIYFFKETNLEQLCFL